MPRERTPASRLATGLTPTDSTSMPSAVRRVTRATPTKTTAASTTETGSPSRKPPPSWANRGFATVMICPSVMSIARPRPAVISTSVAMIGWMPNSDTSIPFHIPSTRLRARAATIATTAVELEVGSSAPAIQVQATEPAMATVAPTDRSIPRVAMTSVIPSAIRAVGVPFFSMSIRIP